ncbi:DUF4367 domain-containing protein [Alicyclobacillus mengziensis]|uniref:DUF4367 domain-containing protein n=1 Tax=Alicyclobacillus mengziensis TaxID=2931921 RepID=A0A9X7VW64_9BACL|nr:DUF4367 domain-containing protein [Alicyclobacillus mengziensis]QSO45642.1 hypothetical protein JZ786_13860 [Alicyclobacillus mengziensis]
MNFESRIRDVMVKHAEKIPVESDLFSKIESRIDAKRKKSYRKWIIGTGVVGVLLMGANTVVFAETGKSLLDVILHTNRVSPGSAMLSDWVFILDGGKSPITDQASPSHRSLPTAPPKQHSSPSQLSAQVQQLGISANGKEFTANHYDQSLNQFLSINQFPKITTGDVQVQFVDAVFKDKATDQFSLDVTGLKRIDNRPEQVRLVLYHNEAGSFQIDGDSSAPGNVKHQVTIDGQNATYISFINGTGSNQQYLTWSRGPWVILLMGEVPKQTFMQIAQSVDQQAQAYQ